MRQCSERVQTTDKQDPIQKCFRVFDPLFKFVIQSRRLYARATDGDSENDFRQDVFSLFAIFNQIASLTTENIIGTQVVLLEHIFPVVEQLSSVMSKAEAAKLLSSLIDSLPSEPHPRITSARMNLVLTTVKSSLYSDTSARSVLLGTICRQLRLHLSHPPVSTSCTESLGHMMNFYRTISLSSDQNKVVYCRLYHHVRICVGNISLMECRWIASGIETWGSSLCRRSTFSFTPFNTLSDLKPTW